VIARCSLTDLSPGYQTDASSIDTLAWIILFEELGPSVVGPDLLADIGLAAILLRQLPSRSDDGTSCLEALLLGTRRAALAVEESGDRWQEGFLTTRADRTSSGIEISGLKYGVAGFEMSDELVVVADDGGEPGVFAVLPNADGLRATTLPAPESDLGLTTLSFDRTSAVALSGGRFSRQWFPGAMDLARLALAAFCLGGASEATDMAISYVRLREQFGRRIAEYQAVSHRCVNMLVTVDQMRALTYRAGLDAASHDDIERTHSVSVARLFCSEQYPVVSASAVGVEGGIGLTWENRLSHHYRRAYWARRLLGDHHGERRRVGKLALATIRAGC
jgi:alkylation response protein AidB-like acyl-CoA dehydrogenase